MTWPDRSSSAASARRSPSSPVSIGGRRGLAGLAAVPVAFLLIRRRGQQAGVAAAPLNRRESETAGARVAVG
jgi:hypothetical protein